MASVPGSHPFCPAHPARKREKDEIKSGVKMLRTIFYIVRKEFIQTFRDKRMLLPLFGAPIIQLILFGYAVTTDVKHISLAVLDYSKTVESRHFISLLTQTEYFDLNFHLDSTKEIDSLLEKGKIKAAVVIPYEYEKNLRKGEKTSLQVLVDGADANTATIVQNYLYQVVAEYSQKVLPELMPKRTFGVITPRPRIWYNPNLKSSIFMVPGIICLILLITTLVLTAMGITREREIGTLEQLIVSPIKAIELILGKTIPFMIIGFCDVILITVAGKIVFDVPTRGSIFFLLGVAFLFILTTLSLGLLISTISRTQQQAMMTAFFFAMPAMLLSGIFSPIDSMPKIIQYLTLLNPLRHFGKVVRGILLKGNNFSDLWPQVLFLFVFGVLAIVLSSLRFRKYLE
jgi:ABC-2 type transport system permease protein